ncbi:exported hypothetical protein [uncultured Paludibacter sp.]|uniref:Uncharacterized protein n=1 Tax=uncultured Paludibacter sp. TaxID=497635 RepID=A0A653ACC1_9BACT|nr:exported hypothetical protein [uncultured Paludibacter sp.]
MQRVIVILILFIGLSKVSAQTDKNTIRKVTSNEIVSMLSFEDITCFKNVCKPTLLFIHSPFNMKSIKMESEVKKYAAKHSDFIFLEFESSQDDAERAIKDTIGYKFYPSCIAIKPPNIYYSFSGYYSFSTLELFLDQFFKGNNVESNTHIAQFSLFNQSVYYGKFDYTKENGNGIIVNPNGVKFIGEMVNGIAKNGSFYEFLSDDLLQITIIKNYTVISVSP